jgi:hypothetical protein
MVINQNSSSPNTIEKYIQNAMALALTPTASTQGTAQTSTVVAASVATAATTAVTVAFGGGATTAAPAEATTEVATASAVAASSFSQQTTTAAAAPAVFTGAAVHQFQAREAQAGLGAGLVIGALLAVW